MEPNSDQFKFQTYPNLTLNIIHNIESHKKKRNYN